MNFIQIKWPNSTQWVFAWLTQEMPFHGISSFFSPFVLQKGSVSSPEGSWICFPSVRMMFLLFLPSCINSFSSCKAQTKHQFFSVIFQWLYTWLGSLEKQNQMDMDIMKVTYSKELAHAMVGTSAKFARQSGKLKTWCEALSSNAVRDTRHPFLGTGLCLSRFSTDWMEGTHI